MLHVRVPRLVVLVALACLALPAPSSAQIGGFIKKKVKQVVKGDTAAASEQKAAPASAGPTFDDYVLQLSPQNLDRLERGLAAEKAFRDSVNRVYAALRTPEQYQRCQGETMTSPEGRQLAANPPQDAAGYQKYAAAMQVLTEKRCGRDPGRLDKAEDLKPAGAVGARAAGATSSQYSIMKERVVPFCRAGGAARVPGEVKGMDYVYAPEELTALQPRCARLMELLGQGAAGSATGSGTAAGGPAFGGDLVELTPDALARLERYYAKVDAYRDSMRVTAGKLKTRDEFQGCAMQYMTGEGQALMQSMAQQGKSAELPAALGAAVEKRCGPDPTNFDREGRNAPRVAAAAVGLTEGQIDLMLERIVPFCTEYGGASPRPFSSGTLRAYSRAELGALQPRCARLMPVIEKHESTLSG
jgi:hypothetical protein